jgi:hypothetical protein
VCSIIIWWFLGVYKVQETTKEEFVANVVHVEMQCRHLYTTRHAARVANAIVVYRAKHEIIHNDMVYGFHFL